MRRLPLLAATALLAAAPAWADTLYTLPGPGPTLETNSQVVLDFAAGAGAGQLSFTIAGHATLDGDNFWIDILHVQLNGSEVFSATWDLGGGGDNRVLLAPAGTTVGEVDNLTHQVQVSLPVTLAAGANQLLIQYMSPATFEDTARAGFQGLGDEGWSLAALTVTGHALPPVPEPASGALLLGGLGVLAGMTRRRR